MSPARQRKALVDSSMARSNSPTEPLAARNLIYHSMETTPRRASLHKPVTPNSKSQESPSSPRRSLIPTSHSLHIKVLLTRLFPPEITLQILSLAGMHHRTSFTRIRRPIPYRERQVRTPHRIYQSVPPTLHLLSPASSVDGIGVHPLRRVKFYLRFCPAKLPNARVRFEARLTRGGKPLQGTDTTLVGSVPMDGKLQSKAVEFGEKTEFVRMAEVGDRIGVWVAGDGGLYGNWLNIPGHEMRVLVEVREVSIECFCEW